MDASASPHREHSHRGGLSVVRQPRQVLFFGAMPLERTTALLMRVPPPTSGIPLVEGPCGDDRTWAQRPHAVGNFKYAATVLRLLRRDDLSVDGGDHAESTLLSRPSSALSTSACPCRKRSGNAR